jgi:hypothetical protein
MTMKSRRARIAFHSSLAVCASVAILLAANPSSRHWLGTSLARSGHGIVSAEPTGRNAAPQKSAAYANSPLRFEENHGQIAPEVRYVAHGTGYELFLTPQEAVLALHPTRRPDPSPMHHMALAQAQRARKAEQSAVLRMRLANASKSVNVAGIDSLPGRVDYFLGNDPTKWRTNIPSYSRVKYADVYPGVDLVFYGNQRRLEYDFIVAPGADPRAIVLNLEGARKLRVNPRGDLLVTVAGGEVQLQKPLVYQQIHGERREIAGDYAITRDHQVSFEVAEYDPREPLIIDPVLVYSTYLGGELDDTAFAIAVDPLGKAVVAGTTLSLHFPTTSGAFNPGPLASNPNGVVFVTEMDATGTHQVYSTYVGGSGGDSGSGVAVDTSGHIYVAGQTLSTDFPTTPNALKPGPNAGNVNGTSFIFKIDPTITGSGSLVYSSYLGGTQGVTEFANGIATDKNGLVYVVGLTASQPGTALANFPVTASTAFQATAPAGIATGTAFLAKLDTTQSGAASLLYSTYFGGNGAHAASPGPSFSDAAFGVAEDPTGNTYVAGTTGSTDFPTTTGTAFQPSLPAGNTGGAGFVSRFDTTKTGAASLLYSTYLGGDSADFADAIALGPSNVAYVTGQTKSLLFRTTPGAFQTTGNTSGIAFISLVDTSLTGAASLKYSTFLSGSQTNMPFGIAADPAGNAYVAGATQGSDFPVTKGAFQRTPAAGSHGEGFVTKLNPGGMGAADLVYSTYFGGSGNGSTIDEVNAIAVVPVSNNAVIAGVTASSAATFPVVPNPGAFQVALNGPSDAFVAELTFQPTLTVSPSSLTFGPQLIGTPTAAQMVTVSNNTTTAIAFSSVAISGGVPAAANTDFTSPANTCGTSIAAGASCTISVVYTPSGAPAETANLVITDADSTSPQTVALSGTGTATALTVTPTTLAFGSQPVGTASAAKMVTLTNNSNSAIAFTSATVSGGSPVAANTDFTSTTTCAASIAANTSCTVSVVFKPSVAAAETANLVLTDTASTSPQTVTLSGTGTSSGGALTVSPTSLAFGSQTINTASAAKMVTLTNNSAAAIAFTGATVSGGSPAAANTDFTSTTTCGTSIAANASCTVSVVFKPSVAAAETANLVLADAAVPNPQTVTLSGTGTASASFSLSAAPTTLTVAQGAKGTFTVTVTPAGGFNQAVTLGCTGAPSAATCTVVSASVTPTDGTTPVTATATVSTTIPSIVAPPSSSPDIRMLLWRTVPLFIAFALLFFTARKQRFAVRVGISAAMLAFLALAGCGGSSHTPTGGTPKGTSTLTVTGTSGSLTSSATVTLTVN